MTKLTEGFQKMVDTIPCQWRESSIPCQWWESIIPLSVMGVHHPLPVMGVHHSLVSDGSHHFLASDWSPSSSCQWWSKSFCGSDGSSSSPDRASSPSFPYSKWSQASSFQWGIHHPMTVNGVHPFIKVNEFQNICDKCHQLSSLSSLVNEWSLILPC